MLVKAKWNVKDAAGWHGAGEVFHTEDNLGDAVEVLNASKKPETRSPAEEPAAEPEKEQPVKSTTRRKVSK